MTQEFHLSVTPVGNDVYLVRTERVAPGVPLAEEQVKWPVEDWLTQARQLMNDPLIGLLQGDRANPFDLGLTGAGLAGLGNDPELNQPPLSLVELGQRLYGSLFQRTLRDSWVTAQGIAQNRNEALRLRLGLKGSRLPRLPWEVLYDNDTPIDQPRSSGVAPAPRPVATGTHVIFSRFRPGTRLATASLAPVNETNQPLRVLMVIAAPDDRERLELEREAHQLQQELRTPTGRVSDRLAGSPPDIQLTILNQPGREQLTEALEQGCYRVLHYAGHSDLGAAGGSLYLVNHQTGLTEILSGDDLAGLLVNNGIRLAVFNSCRGAYTAASDPSIENERNLAEALVGRGIPAVLAMAEQIPDNVALTLTWLFYRNLKQGYPIDLSLSRARQGLISAYGSHQLYWALPILYLHPEFDGYLTAADRSDENPADRLILLPQGYSGLPVLAPQEVATPLSPLTGTEDLLTEEDGLADTREDEDEPVDLGLDLQNSDLDETYEEDAQLVADLLRQLTPPEINDAELLELSDPLTPFDRTSARSGSGVTRTSTRPSGTATQVSGVPTAIVHTQADTATGQLTHPRRRWSPVVGVVGAVTLAMLGIWAWTQIDKGIVLHLPGNQTISLGGAKDLKTADIDEVQRIAISHFEQGRFAEGEQAVAVLLDRNALQQAAEALQTVPTTIDTAGVNYLWGRLAWQGLETGNPIYKLEDAREYWEKAVKTDPNNPKYHEALGFAYYAENRPNLAVKSWMAAVSLLESQASIAATAPEAQNAVATKPDMSQDLLNNYAGIALGLWKSSRGQAYTEREDLAHKATKIYQMVTKNDPDGFKPQTLSQNWLWQRSIVRDWQTLSQVE